MLRKEYLPNPICSSPLLPPNVSIEFPPYIQQAGEIYKNPKNKEKVREANKKIIEEYLLKIGTCDVINPNIVNDMRLRLFTLSDKILDNILSSTEGLNSGIHDDIACMISAITYEGKIGGVFSPTQRERVKNWFTNVKLIGKPSVEGYALTTSLSSNSNLFVMKTPREIDDDNLIHEAIIGLYCTNKLRRIIPNFMYVYGYVSCSGVVTKNDDVVAWCSSVSGSTSYLITERIRDSIPFYDFIRKSDITAEDVIKIFFQIENALNIAYKFYKYTHYDLHYNNILIRTFLEPVAIPYYSTTGKVVGHIITKYVPYIIDYGFNTAKVGSISLGKVGFEEFSVDSQNPYPMHDTYKLICFLGESIYSYSSPSSNAKSIKKVLNTLFSFFNEGDIEDRIKRRDRNDFYEIDKYPNVTHDDYITWMEKIYNPVSKLRGNIKEAIISQNITTCDFYKSIGINSPPRTSLEYCEAINAADRLPIEQRDNAIKWLDERFSSEDYFNGKKYQLIDTATSMEIKSLPVITKINQLQSSKFTNIYKESMVNILKSKEMASNLSSFIRASICSLSKQQKFNKYYDEITEMNNMLKQFTKYIEKERNTAINNMKYIYSVIKQVNLNDYWTREYPDLLESL